MLLLIREWTLQLIFLLGLGLSGGFMLAPFNRGLPYLWLAAPLAGIGTLSLGLTLGHLLDLPLHWNLPLNLFIFSGLTLCRLPRRVRPARVFFPSLLVLLLSGLCTLTVQEPTLRSRGPAVLLKDGTDSLGYAHVADWLRTHRRSEPPIADPSVPYQSWPSLYQTDHRSGAYLFLAALSLLRGESGLFTFDFACAVVLCAGLLGFGGAFAQSRTGLLLLLAGAMVSSLFDLSRSGFFGKILAYSCAILVASLILQSLEDMDVERLSRLVALAIGASLLQSGMSVALFLCLAWTGVPVTRLTHWISRSGGKASFGSPGPSLWLSFTSLATVAGLAAASWFLVKSGLPYGTPTDVIWSRALRIGLDLQHHTVHYKRIPAVAVNVLFVSTLVTHLVLAGVAIHRRNTVAVGLLSGPLIFLLLAWNLDLRFPFWQSMVVLYLFSLAGAVRLWEDPPPSSPRVSRIAIWLLLILLIGSRVPRFIVAADRYLGTRVFAGERYRKSDLDRMYRTIGTKTLDLHDPLDIYPAMVVLVELGRRGVTLQMDPKTWRALVGHHRGWPPPPIEQPGDLLVLPADAPPVPETETLFHNSQYRLVRRAQPQQ